MLPINQRSPTGRAARGRRQAGPAKQAAADDVARFVWSDLADSASPARRAGAGRTTVGGKQQSASATISQIRVLLRRTNEALGGGRMNTSTGDRRQHLPQYQQ